VFADPFRPVSVLPYRTKLVGQWVHSIRTVFVCFLGLTMKFPASIEAHVRLWFMHSSPNHSPHCAKSKHDLLPKLVSREGPGKYSSACP
jgi:hypothetical protein